MEVVKSVNSEEFNANRHSRIKQNVRVVSASKQRKRLTRLCSKSSDLENRLSSASSSTSKVSLEIENLKKELARRASTMPDLFESYDLKAIYEETTLRRQFREVIATRNHTSPAVQVRQSVKDPIKGIYRHLNKPTGPVDDALNGLMEKDNTKLKEYLKKHNVPRSSIPSGLWNMAASTVYEHRASVTHSFEDLAMAFLSKQIAIKKMRQKIARKLELPVDRFKRIALLRQNVNFIEQKFENMKQVRPKMAKSFDNLDVFEEVDTSDLPSRFTQPGMAKTYFKKSGRLVLIVLNWIFLIMDGSESTKLERELKSFVDIAHEAVNTVTSSQSMEEQGLSFDKQVYKANKEISLSQEHRKILTTRANFRTPQMIKQVMHGLQAIRSLSDYPLRTQERLCQVAWYQTIGPKKVIIRQGHNAESFYFIVSGTAFVKKMVRNERSGETKVQAAARLTRGQSFGFSWEDGEIGLIFNTKRTATVESSTPMELLVVGKEDFNAIFMRSEDHDEEAEHVKFLRSVPIMSQWPIECLVNEPGTCVLHYFKRGHLITPNGKTSEWIYFVKSGTCEVMKELKSPKARKSGQSNLRPDPISDIMLPELGVGAAPRVDTGIAHKRKFVMTPEVFEEMSKYYDKLKQKLKEIKKAEKEDERENMLKNQSAKKKEQQSSTLPKLAINNQLVKIKEDQDVEFTGSIKSSEILMVPPVESLKPDKSKGISSSTFDNKMLSLLKMKPHYMFPTASMIEKEAPTKYEREMVSQDNTVRKNSVFVHVQLLQAKDVFGLNTLSWGSCDIDDMVTEAPQLCLVSRGAEIVMMSKRVFLKYSNDRVKTMLREQVRPYPTENALQDTFQTKVDWDSYKSNLLENVLKNQCTLKGATGVV